MTATTTQPTRGTDGRTQLLPAVTERTAGIIAGVGYVALFVIAIFANFVVREGMVVSGDAMLTAANIADAEVLFRIGLVGFLAIFAIDVVVAWALYIVFRRVQRDVSLLAAWLRLGYTVMLGVALVFFFQALQWIGQAEFLSGFSLEQANAQALVAIDTFNAAWMIGLALFGLHILVLGWLILRSGVAPKLLGAVLILAGAFYVIDTVALSMLGNYEEYSSLMTALVAGPSVIAEGWFGLWLLLRAGKPVSASSGANV